MAIVDAPARALVPLPPLPEPRRPDRWLRFLVVAVVLGALVTATGWAWILGVRGRTPERTLARGTRPHVTVPMVLAAQDKALLAGDEAAWLADVDPAQPALVQRYRDRFRMLRALHVTGFEQAAPRAGSGRLDAPTPPVGVTTRYCLVTPDCVPASTRNASELTESVVFTPRAGRVLITARTQVPAKSRSRQTPTPWQDDVLEVREGARTTVAAPASVSARLDEVAAVAERAAPVADRFARPGQPPARYLIFLAGPQEWRTWFTGGGDALGYAVTTNRRHVDVVLNVDEIRDGEWDNVVTHELGHVATLSDPVRPGYASGPAWLVEGLAEYIAWSVRDPAGYERLPSVARFLDQGKWDDTFPVVASGADVSAVYGIGYLALTHLARAYGEDAMLRFAYQVMRAGDEYERAAQAAFGKPWPTIMAECARGVRRAASG